MTVILLSSRVSRLPRLRLRLVTSAGLAVLGLGLAGCASSSHIADLPLVGVPASTPARPEVPPAYLPVDDTPPPRSDRVLTPQEQDKTAKELIAARDRQAQIAGKTPNPPAQQ
jgi:hypothetical protein